MFAEIHFIGADIVERSLTMEFEKTDVEEYGMVPLRETFFNGEILVNISKKLSNICKKYLCGQLGEAQIKN